MARMKRRVTLLLVAAVVALALMPVQAARAYTTTFGVTYKSDTVNLRQQATQYSTLLGSYTRGTWMTITGESGNWYYVTAPDGKTGYMSKNYVQVHQPVYAAVAAVTNPKASSFLNLRAAPSYGAKVLGIYYNTCPAVLMDYANGWYHVRVGATEGYFREEYLVTIGSAVAYSTELATVVTPNNSGLNLRTGPGMGYSSIMQFNGGQYVMVLQQGNGWWKVSAGGQVGFMNSDFLRAGLLSPSEWNNAGQGSAATSSGSVTGYGLVSNPRATQLLNLRESPATTARVIGQYMNGTRVNVVHQGVEWCKVQVVKTGSTGYMMTDYLTLYNLPSVPVKTVTHPQKTFVNLRSSPSMTAGKILTRMPHGATVTVLIPGDSWVKVQYNGYTGYAMAVFLK